MNSTSPNKLLFLLACLGSLFRFSHATEAQPGSAQISGASGTQPPASHYPADHWEKAAQPESHGFSGARLDSLTPFLESLDTTSMMVVADGRVVYQYGDTAAISYLASTRKSVLAMMYGKYVESGLIRLEQTLRDLAVDDVGGLLPSELDATIDNVITSRSGVFHPAGYRGDAGASAPPRGSQSPGQYYLYNNWDFNVAGAIFEKLTGKDIYESLHQDLAIPVGMEDFDLARQKKGGDVTQSIYLGYPMDLSTRDMARLGHLMLRQGQWNGRQIVPKEWVKKITSLVTPPQGINPPFWRGYAEGSLWGYGYMWWVWDDQGLAGPLRGAYTSWGVYGQFITVLPELNTIIAHKTIPGRNQDGRPRNVSVMQYQAILMHIIAAHDKGSVETRR